MSDDSLPWEEARVRGTLEALGALYERAEYVAQAVFDHRWPKGGIHSFNVDLKYAWEEDNFSASYYAGSSDNEFVIPVAYLWCSAEQIAAFEVKRAWDETERKRVAAEAHEQQQLEYRHNAYLKLKAEFEPDARA